MLSGHNLLVLIAINILIYAILRRYFGCVRTWLYLLLAIVSIFIGYVLDMLALDRQGYAVPIAMSLCFAALVAMCVYDKLFEDRSKSG